MTEGRARIDPIRPRLRWRALSRTPISSGLSSAVYETLAGVGVRFPLERALGALERGGCRVDHTSQVARMPEEVVRAALQATPVGLAPRRPRPTLRHRARRLRLPPEQRRLRGARHRPGERRAATEHQGGRRRQLRPLRRCSPPGELLLGPHRDRRGRAAGRRGRCTRSEAVFANTSKHFQAVDIVGEAHGAPRGRDGARRGGRGRGTPTPARHEPHRLPDRPAQQRGRQPRGGAGLCGRCGTLSAFFR